MSTTHRKGLSQKKISSCGVCCKCGASIPKVSDQILEHTKIIPDIVNNIIMSYFECPEPYIGYAKMHVPTRRRNHVVCMKCHGETLEFAFDYGYDSVVCSARDCFNQVHINTFERNTVDDYFDVSD